jgi:hypothetical protein
MINFSDLIAMLNVAVTKKQLRIYNDYNNSWIVVPKELWYYMYENDKKPISSVSRQKDDNFYLDMKTDGKDFLRDTVTRGWHLAIDTRHQHFESSIMDYDKID